MRHRRTLLAGEGLLDFWITRLEGIDNEVADKVGDGGKALRQFLGGVDGGGLGSEEIGDEFTDGAFRERVDDEAVVFTNGCEANDALFLSVDVPAEFEVISEEEVVERFEVAFHLVRFFDAVEFDADILGFDVPQWHFTLLDDEIRCAAGLLPFS